MGPRQSICRRGPQFRGIAKLCRAAVPAAESQRTGELYLSSAVGPAVLRRIPRHQHLLHRQHESGSEASQLDCGISILNMRTLKLLFGLWFLVLPLSLQLHAGDVTLTARVELVSEKGKPEPGTVVLWLTPIGVTPVPATARAPAHLPQLVQKNKSFHPGILVVPVGSEVQFPNRDPFFHNVFSLFEGKRFDLGLYEAGSTKDVRFDKQGISYIFCNIHPQMNAVVIALNTPYYGISDKKGQVLIPYVPPGRYELHTWYEAAVPDT